MPRPHSHWAIGAVLAVLAVIVIAVLVNNRSSGGRHRSGTAVSCHYKPPPAPTASGGGPPYNVRAFGATGNGTTDDSGAFNAAVAAAARAGGGTVVVPAGRYMLAEIGLKSNVHVQVAAGATLLPAPTRGPCSIFRLGTMPADPTYVHNVSVEGTGGSFTIDLSHPGNPLMRGFANVNVDGFTIQNVNGIENNSNQSGGAPSSHTAFLTFRPSPLSKSGGPYWDPQNGDISNIKVVDAPYGFGATQVSSGSHLTFDNISSTGGIALRLETDSGLPGMVTDLTGSDITCLNGHAAVSFSPHGQDNGSAHVSNVTAISCAYAVVVGGHTHNGSGGVFQAASVTGVHFAAGSDAQVAQRSHHQRVWITAPSVACVLQNPTASYHVQIAPGCPS